MRLRHLDALRALLALMVLIGHARMLLWMSWSDWSRLQHGMLEKLLGLASGVFRYGGTAVMVFFSLSGYFIHLRVATQLAHDGPARFDARDYVRRRARRILPPYYVALLLTVVLDLAGRHWWPRLYLAQTGDPMLDTSLSLAGYSWSSVLPALCAQPSLFGHFGSNGPLWSIGNEVLYYAVYPLFMWVWLRSRWLAYATGFAVGVLASRLGFGGCWAPALASYPVWLAGALLAEWSAAHPDMIKRKSWFYSAVVIAAVAFGASHVACLSGVVMSVFIGAATVAAAGSLPFDLMRSRIGCVLEWLGIRSYSIYIMHFPVLVLISAWCFQFWGERPASGWLAVAGVLVSLGVALVMFHCVERFWLPGRKDTEPGRAGRP